MGKFGFCKEAAECARKKCNNFYGLLVMNLVGFFCKFV